MIVTIAKTFFQRLQPKVREYRDYSNCDHNIFRGSLFIELSKLNIEVTDLNKFFIVCIDALNSHASS